MLTLARHFADRQLFAEAAELVQLGRHIDPKSSGLRLVQAEIHRLQRQYQNRSPKTLRDTLRERFRRDTIDVSHFLGLARLYAERGENARVLECLEIARAKQAEHPGLHKLQGQVLARRKDYEGAAEHLGRALRFDPFDREVAELLGRVEYERRQFRDALSHTIHAFLLLNDGDAEGAERLRRRIQTLKQILQLANPDLLRLFREAREGLHLAFDRLEWKRERFLEEGGMLEVGLAPPGPPRSRSGGLLDLAARLRRMRVWEQLGDEQVIELAQTVREELFQPGSRVFSHGEVGEDLFLLERGRIQVQRQTHYGTFQVGSLSAGSLFGEVNFISRLPRTGDALAAEPAVILRLEAAAVQALVERDPDLGVQLYWTFWRSLAQKLRSTNDQLRSFFTDESQSENFVRLRHQHPAVERQVQVDDDDKIRLFREQGLSRSELTILATFLRERRYPEGTVIFEEGDEGREMYFILEGRARISKFIPGAGEEALGILNRGDFFGEMSLVDGEPRSADARAHGGPLTVLTLDQESFREILALDPQASLDFLQLLCRLMTQRLREIDEKVIGWRILAGSAPAASGVGAHPAAGHAGGGSAERKKA